MNRLRLVCCATLAVLGAAVGCGRDRGDGGAGSNRVAETLSVFTAEGPPRIFVADQDSSGTRLCFDAPDLGLPPGAPVTVVHSAFPQYSTTGKLGKRGKSPCFPPPRASPDSMQYAVDAPGDTIGRRGVPIILVGRLPNAKMRGDTVELEVEAGKQPWRFRSCASAEGIHATAWAGVPLASERRWHAYYYLGYDVEPDCTPADYASDSATAKI